MEYEQFSGAVMDFQTAVEYNPWKHVGLGLGFDALNVRVKADGDDYPAVDLNGKVDYNFTGLQLYLHVFF